MGLPLQRSRAKQGRAAKRTRLTQSASRQRLCPSVTPFRAPSAVPAPPLAPGVLRGWAAGRQPTMSRRGGLTYPKGAEALAVCASTTAAAQVLVRLHVEPHREQRELRAEDQKQRDEHDRRRGDVVSEDPEDDLGDAEPEAEEAHQEPEQIEEHERMEIANHILLAHSPEETLDQQPRDCRNNFPQSNSGTLADSVNRARGVIPNAPVPDVQMHEHVVRESITLIDPIEVE